MVHEGGAKTKTRPRTNYAKDKMCLLVRLLVVGMIQANNNAAVKQSQQDFVTVMQ